MGLPLQSFHKQTTKEIKCAGEIKSDVKFVSETSQGSCFKLLYESRTSSFRRGAKLEITERIGGESRKKRE